MTVPLPVTLTLRVYWAVGGGGLAVKVAVTARLALIAGAQLAVPPQSPLQPVKAKPLAGVALKVMLLPAASVSVQSLPQEIPAGVGVLLTLPLPTTLTLRVYWATGGGGLVVKVKLAVTARPALRVRVQLGVLPLQSPLQPVNV